MKDNEPVYQTDIENWRKGCDLMRLLTREDYDDKKDIYTNVERLSKMAEDRK